MHQVGIVTEVCTIGMYVLKSFKLSWENNANK